MKIDLRPRCKRCKKLIRGKQCEAAFKIYQPYCSYHCQQWAALEDVHNSLKGKQA